MAAGHRISPVNGRVRTVLKFSPPLLLILSTTPFSSINFTTIVIHWQAEIGSVNYSQLKILSFQRKMWANSTSALKFPWVYERSGQHQAKQGRKRFTHSWLGILFSFLLPAPSTEKSLYFRSRGSRIIRSWTMMRTVLWKSSLLLPTPFGNRNTRWQRTVSRSTGHSVPRLYCVFKPSHMQAKQQKYVKCIKGKFLLL